MDQSVQAIGSFLLNHRYFPAFEEWIINEKIEVTDRLLDLLHLRESYLKGDLDRVKKRAADLGFSFLVAPSLLEQRVYRCVQAMELKLRSGAYDDYLRQLTPLLVDIFRLLVQEHILADLDRYLIEVFKETVEGRSIYRGIRWNQDQIESHPNLVQATFNKYYGEYFNYDHYLSSSHLMKIIEANSQDRHIVDLAKAMRQIEKYTRNIVAHELIHVDDAWLLHRIGKNSSEIHHDVISLANKAGLKDMKQWQGLKLIEKAIRQEYQLGFNK